MGKLSKREIKEQKAIKDLLDSKDKFNHEETELIYQKFNEAVLGDVTSNSAYFTPLDLAYDFALMSPIYGVAVDMCAGIGVLSYAAMCRDYYRNDIKKIICLERDSRYIEIGKKLVQSNEHIEVVWIQGDIFDENIWKQIVKEHGKIDSIYSNPPFGSVTKSDKDRSWLKYKGSDLDIASIEIAIKQSESQSFILPQGSCTFRASGRYQLGGAEHIENRKIAKLKKEMGCEFYMSWSSIDTTVYEEGFKNTKITVECCSIADLIYV